MDARAVSVLAVWILAGAACATGKGSSGTAPAADSETIAEDEAADDSFEDADTTAPSRGEGSVSVTYARSAAENWRRGEAEFADEEYLAAQKYYTFIRSKFPYSAFAVRAELRIADCLFERGRYLEAIDAYSNFQRLHPTHKQVGYAAFKVGLSYYEQIPGEWFLLPPAHEKDQASVRDAARALSNYVDRFKNDANHARGVELLNETRSRLVAHERAVADFYKNIDKPKAYVGRLEVIRQRYGDVALTDELLFEIAEAYVSLGDLDRAKDAVDELAAKFPGSKVLDRARSLVRSRAG